MSCSTILFRRNALTRIGGATKLIGNAKDLLCTHQGGNPVRFTVSPRATNGSLADGSDAQRATFSKRQLTLSLGRGDRDHLKLRSG